MSRTDPLEPVARLHRPGHDGGLALGVPGDGHVNPFTGAQHERPGLVLAQVGGGDGQRFALLLQGCGGVVEGSNPASSGSTANRIRYRGVWEDVEAVSSNARSSSVAVPLSPSGRRR